MRRSTSLLCVTPFIRTAIQPLPTKYHCIHTFARYSSTSSKTPTTNTNNDSPIITHHTQTWLLIAKDGGDEKALERRLAARTVHLPQAIKDTNEGKILIGGAVLHEEKHHMNGSVMILDGFKSKKEVEDYISKDPYVTMGVWKEWDILPFKIAVMRKPPRD